MNVFSGSIEKVDCRAIPMEDFAAFVKNWDDEEKPFSAVIRNLDEWNEVFSPAVVMGDKRPTAPDKAFFEEEALVVLSIIGPPAQDKETSLSVVALRTRGISPGPATVLHLFYLFEPPPETEGEMKVKHTVLLAISQADAQLPLLVDEEINWRSNRSRDSLNIGSGYTF